MHYKHVNNIIAVYLNYGVILLERLSLKAGVRYEYNHQNVQYVLGNGTDFTAQFNDWVPSGSIGWNLTNNSNLVAAYSMRILRPGIAYLNPYLNDNDPMTVSQGNPNLESEKINSINLNYNLFTNKVNLNVTLDYTFINNAIQQVSYLLSDREIVGLPNPSGVEVLYSTYANSGKSKTALLRIFFSWNIARQTRFFINGIGNYLSLQANELSNQGWGAMVNGGLQQSFKYDWSLALNLFYVTAPIKLQGQGSQFLNYGLSVSKLFFNKRFTVMARVTNPFTPYTIFGENRIGTSFSQDS